MELGDRKKKILQLIVESYIETAEPVGSRYIAKKNDLSLSPATMRWRTLRKWVISNSLILRQVEFPVRRDIAFM